MSTRPVAALALVALLLTFACEARAEPPRATPADLTPYPWAAEWEGDLPDTTPLEAAFPTPQGLTRLPAPQGSWAAWLRRLPVRRDRADVRSFRGDTLRAPAAAVILLDVGDRDVQQCADTAIRLHAEYLWHAGHADAAAYHFTSGDRSAWKDWRQGERFALTGNKVRRNRTGSRANNHSAYRAWLQHTFRYAGTQSLRLDSDPVPPGQPLLPGDFFVTPGAPGHAVILLDVAQDDQGRRWGLVGQGFMPAQDLHVVTRAGARDKAWLPLPDDAEDALDTPSWAPFPRTTARRFKMP